MSKKSNRFKGYLLVEALFTLGVLGLITGIYMAANLNLLRKNRQSFDCLSMYRVLFEELQEYDTSLGTISKNRILNDQRVQINFSQNKGELAKVEISNEKEHFFIHTEKSAKE